MRSDAAHRRAGPAVSTRLSNTAERSCVLDVDLDALEWVLQGDYAEHSGFREKPVRNPQVASLIGPTVFLRPLELIQLWTATNQLWSPTMADTRVHRQPTQPAQSNAIA